MDRAKITEQDLIDSLNDPTSDIESRLHFYFDQRPEMDWIELHDEARRITNVLADADLDQVDHIHEDTVNDIVLAVVAAAAWDNALSYIAEYLGLDRDAVQTFVYERVQSEFIHDKCGPERFVELVNKCDVWLRALRASKDENETLPEWSLS